jgi:hypothetical protein
MPFALMLTTNVFSARGDEPRDRDELYRGFEKAMSNVVLQGRFTVLGKDQDSLAEESYEIQNVRKLPEGDYWLFQARIQYADKDVTLPLPLEVKWAGETPVITVRDLTIPGLGTFGARVLIQNQKYAGTWTHGQASGHLFGTIRRRTE